MFKVNSNTHHSLTIFKKDLVELVNKNLPENFIIDYMRIVYSPLNFNESNDPVLYLSLKKKDK